MNEELLYGSITQAYRLFMDNDDDAKDDIVQKIADEMSMILKQ